MATEKRLIDANELLVEIEKVYADHYEQSAYQFIHDFVNSIRRRIRRASTVDAVEVKHGRWEKIIGVITPGGNTMVRCSVCKSRESEHLCYIASTPWHYCPNCGAKMDLK